MSTKKSQLQTGMEAVCGTYLGLPPLLNCVSIIWLEEKWREIDVVGTDENLQEQLVKAMLMEPKTFELNIHLAKSLPLPPERDHLRPRIDLIVFIINLQSQHSFSTVQSSLAHLDSSFFLGKVCFLAIGGGRVKHRMVEMSAVKTLADTYLSTLLLADLESEAGCSYIVQRLLQLLRVCAGHVSGVSALYLGSIMKRSDTLSQDT